MNFPKAKKIITQRYEGGLSRIPGLTKSIKLSSNESALGCSSLALRAFSKTKNNISRYPDSNNNLLKETIARKFKLKQDRVIVGCGSDEIISFACQAFLKEKDEVIVTAFSFLMYRVYSQINGAKVVFAKEKSFKTDIQSILRCVSKKTKIVFLANPNNPTGTYLNKSELKLLRRKLPSRILLLIDDAYCEYMQTKDYTSGLELFKNSKNVLVTRTFSKIYGLASLRLGWGYASKDIISSLMNVKPPFNVTTGAEAAGVAALKDTKWINKNIKHNNTWSLKIYKKLKEKKINCNSPSANFFLMQFDRSYDANDIFKKFSASKIILRKMNNYKIKNSLRVTVGNAHECKLFIKLIDRIFNVQ